VERRQGALGDLGAVGLTTASLSFWRGRRVLVTGHTGFKGSWLALRLAALGAVVTGLALDPPTRPSHFELAGVGARVRDRRVDLRDAAGVPQVVSEAEPEVVFHLAAQALVRAGYEQPLDTLDINVQGSARLFEALRAQPPAAIVAVTSDKVYLNDDLGRAFREDDPLGGSDPYSGSKSAAEMVARLYRDSFDLPLATARAGNVIGGGDFAPDRLLPDVWRALGAKTQLVLRRPQATRPWSHVLDIVEGYILYAEALAEQRPGLPAALNFGPAPGADPLTVIESATLFAETLGSPLDWRLNPAPYAEKSQLAIDSSLARATLGWTERFPGREGVRAAAAWQRAQDHGADLAALSSSLVAVEPGKAAAE
jgi:CDP-glucose 4,6-dehydratase